MSGFRIIPLQRCLEIINTWARAPWPLTTEQADTIAIGLGWRPIEGKALLFAGDLAADEGDSFVTSLQGQVGSVDFPLVTRVAKDQEAEAGPLNLALFHTVVEALQAHYGKPTLSNDGRFNSATWTLGSGVTIDLDHSPRFFTVTINSPARTALLADAAADPNLDEKDF